MGLSQDGPIGPSQQANPQDSPPTAPRHPARAPSPLPRSSFRSASPLRGRARRCALAFGQSFCVVALPHSGVALLDVRSRS